MVDLRKDKTAPAALKVRYKSRSVDEFARQYGPDISNAGIFVKTKKPVEAGALLKFEFQLADGTAVFHGVGWVSWRREPGAAGAPPPGMGIKFLKLDAETKALVDRIVGSRAGAASRFEDTRDAELASPSLAPAAGRSMPPMRSARPVHSAPPVHSASPVRSAPPVHSAPPVPSAPPVHSAPPVRSAPPVTAGAPSAKPAIPAPPPPARSSRPPPPLRPVAKVALGAPAKAPAIAPPRPIAPPAARPTPMAAAGAPDRAPPLRAPAGLVSGASGAPFDKAQRASLPGAPVAGLFARSAMSQAAPPAPAAVQDAPRTSFFPEAPSPAPPRSAQAATASEFLATAFAEGGAAAETADRARAEALRARSSSPPAPPVPSRKAEADDVDELFAALDDGPAPVESRSSVPSAAPLRASSLPPPAADPESEPADAAGGMFGSFRAPPADAFAEPAWDEPDELDARGEASYNQGWTHDEATNEFGEADLFGDSSSIPAAALREAVLVSAAAPASASYAPEDATTSLSPSAPPPATPSEPPSLRLSSIPPPDAEVESGTSPLIWLLLLLALAVGGGVFFYMHQSNANAPVREVEETELSAPRAAAGRAGEPVRVNISSSPRGADILVDGKRSGSTPATLSLPRGSKVEVTIKTPGYAAMTKTVAVGDDTTHLKFELQPLDFELIVRTTPPGAEVTVEDVTAISPAPLQLGHLDSTVQVGIAAAGHQRMTRPIRLEEFTESDGKMRATIEVSLTRIPGASLTPSSASSSRRRAKARSREPGEPPQPDEPSEAIEDSEPSEAVEDSEPSAAPEASDSPPPPEPPTPPPAPAPPKETAPPAPEPNPFK